MATYKSDRFYSLIQDFTYFSCDICGSKAIIATTEGFECRSCGFVLKIQKLQHNRPYNKTVKDVTQEIIDVMSLNEFPQIPFVVKGYFEGVIEKMEALESDVVSLQDLIELWHIDGKNEHLSLENIMFSHRILFNLRHLRVRNFPLVELAGEEELSQGYYEKLLTFYVKKLHLIKCSMAKWSKFLFTVESKRKSDLIDNLKTIQSGFKGDGGGP